MNTKSHHRRAFTLVELLLVLALLVVIAGFTAMALEGSIFRSRLAAAEEQVRTAWGDARLQTVTTGEQMAFTCLVGGRDYRLSSLGDLAAPAEGEQSTATGQTGKLPDGVVFKSLRAAPRNAAAADIGSPPIDDGQWSAPVVFDPDGASYDAVVILESESGKLTELSLRGLTCTALSRDAVGEQ